MNKILAITLLVIGFAASTFAQQKLVDTDLISADALASASGVLNDQDNINQFDEMGWDPVCGFCGGGL